MHRLKRSPIERKKTNADFKRLTLPCSEVFDMQKSMGQTPSHHRLKLSQRPSKQLESCQTT
eukprot:1825380-Ditylum_brightwellii.AAC.1